MGPRKYRSVLGRITVVVVGAIIAFTTRGEAPAAEPNNPAIVPFSEFVNSLRIAPADAFVGQSGLAVKSAAAFGEMRQHLLKMYSGVAVAHSLSRDKQVFDCVPVNDQPGVRVRKLKRIAVPPPIPPSSIWGQGQESSSPSVRETDTSSGLDAPGGQRCEDGSIPVRRLTLDEMTRFATLKDYFAKGPEGAGRVPRDRGSIPPAFNGHSYAHAYQSVTNSAAIRASVYGAHPSTPVALRSSPFHSNGMLAEVALSCKPPRSAGRITRQNMDPKTRRCLSTGQRTTTTVPGVTTSIAPPSCKSTAIGRWEAVSRTIAPSADHSTRWLWASTSIKGTGGSRQVMNGSAIIPAVFTAAGS
jgi:hypothetical protein